jgi:hypothetical protein
MSSSAGRDTLLFVATERIAAAQDLWRLFEHQN